MLDNLKLVLLQHKKFLAIFFVVVFLPSIVLAFLGIRAIYNERYKLQQQNLEQQKRFVGAVKTGILSHIERNLSKLKELSVRKVFSEKDYRGIHDLISENLKDESLFGHIVVWNLKGSPWLPGFQASPPGVKTFLVPEEWKRWQPDLEMAESAEFRRRNFSEAVSLYKRIFDRAEDYKVKAWMLSRIARCEIKKGKFKQAMNAYRSIIADYPDLLTESGRPLELASRLEMLDALRLDRNHVSFFRESLQTCSLLEQNIWSLDGEQIKMYTAILKNMIDEVIAENLPDEIPENYVTAIGEIQDGIAKKWEIWQMADEVRRNILPGIREKLENMNSGSPVFQKRTLEFEGNEVLALLVGMERNDPGHNFDFLGSLFRPDDVIKTIENLVEENSLQGVSLVLQSTQSNKIIFGRKNVVEEKSIITEYFPENFPPWKLELFQMRDSDLGFSFHKNIFFWTILALLIIVFVGSGLIIRTLVQEVSLLNLKSEFIASVSHEFKTPLTSMGAILEHLLTGEVKDPAKTREYYRILSHDSERLRRLVKNILDFTKIEEGKREYRLVSTDIVYFVRQEVASFIKENQSDGLTIKIEIGSDIPPVSVDGEALSQVLHNILDNAAKFSSQGKEIIVEVVRRGKSIEIAVQDKGIGIPESEQKKIFEKFYRGKQASSVSPTGTGLGLTLVKHIMKAHKGDVVVRSQLGEGSCVSLILPIGEGG